jgi:hypothetical protein
VVLVVTELRVRVAIDVLHYPLGILELHLYDFLPLRVDFLFALPLAGRRTILAWLLHLLTELLHELLDIPALRRAMMRRVVHQTFCTAVVTVGWLAGAFVASWASTAPSTVVAAAAAVGAPASGWLSPAFFLLLLMLPLPSPWACVPVLGLLSPFTAWATGECQALPSTTLAHLSARLKSAETS